MPQVCNCAQFSAFLTSSHMLARLLVPRWHFMARLFSRKERFGSRFYCVCVCVCVYLPNCVWVVVKGKLFECVRWGGGGLYMPFPLPDPNLDTHLEFSRTLTYLKSAANSFNPCCNCPHYLNTSLFLWSLSCLSLPSMAALKSNAANHQAASQMSLLMTDELRLAS